MSGGIGYELVILAGELLVCLGAVIRFAGVDPTEERRRWFALAGTLAYWGVAGTILDVYGSLGTFVPLIVGPLLGTVAVVCLAHLG